MTLWATWYGGGGVRAALPSGLKGGLYRTHGISLSRCHRLFPRGPIAEVTMILHGASQSCLVPLAIERGDDGGSGSEQPYLLGRLGRLNVAGLAHV